MSTAASAGLWGPGSTFGGALTKLGGAPAAFTAATGLPYYVPIAGLVTILLVIVIVIIYAVSAAQSAPAVKVEGPIDLFSPKDPIIVDRGTAKSTLKNSYTIAFFLNITAVPDMRVEATPLLIWPGVWGLGYNAGQESLVWTIVPYPDAQQTMSPTLTIKLPKVTMQRWNQVAITFEGRTMDFYINGSLIQSNTLTNLPQPPSASITKVPNGAMGQIAYIQSWPRRLTMGEIADNYTSVSDSQGRPLLTTSFFPKIFTPNLFCPSGDCTGSSPTASPSQVWEFPYQ
jgi:hypothetical protein